MTNTFYTYPGYEFWDDSLWEGRLQSPLYPMIQWLGRTGTVVPREYAHPVDSLRGEECRTLDCYTKKTNCVAAPDVTEYWAKRGLFYRVRSIGGVRWIVCGPDTALKDHVTRLPALIVYRHEDYSDPYWAMKVLEDCCSYLETAAEKRDFLLMFFVVQRPDTGGYFVEILQEASTCFPFDFDRMYLDCTALRETGTSLQDIPGYTYTEKDGTPVADPDSRIFPFTEKGFPALDISGRWASRYSLNRKQVLTDDFSNANYDRERFLHSATAARMLPGIEMDHRFDRADSPEFAAYWDEKGVQCAVHCTCGERWITFVPKSALEPGAKPLPLVVCAQEIGGANGHLAVTSVNYLYEAPLLAAQGEFIALFFILEDPDSNELLLDILKEAEALYPVDTARLYMMGHSHNGLYTHELIRRHPQLMAAAATLGNPPNLAGRAGTAAGTDDTEDKIAEEALHDVPIIDMVGTCEMKLYFPVAGEQHGLRKNVTGAANDAGQNLEERIKGWQDRLRSMNCPVKTREEIAASLQSPDTVTRFLGFPADRAELLYLDGVNHYIADIRNNEGKYHFRVVGIENMPHFPTPSMIDLAWSFLKRFARNPETGKVTELY